MTKSKREVALQWWCSQGKEGEGGTECQVHHTSLDKTWFIMTIFEYTFWIFIEFIVLGSVKTSPIDVSMI